MKIVSVKFATFHKISICSVAKNRFILILHNHRIAKKIKDLYITLHYNT